MSTTTNANGYAPGLTDGGRRFNESGTNSNMMRLIAERFRHTNDVLSFISGSGLSIGTSRTFTAGIRGFLCLYATDGVDLRGPLRAGATDAELAGMIAARWAARTDRGAEERLGVAERGTLFQLESLRADPRREMHTRGG